MLKAVPHIRRPRPRVRLQALASALLIACCAVGGAMRPTCALAAERSWRLDEFSRIELSPAEAGATNSHPAHLTAASLHDALGTVTTTVRGETVPLFAAEELDDLAPALAKAFDNAGPQDDVLLLSTARREGRFATPTALTARLFVRDGKLQLIVHEARQEFMEAYRRAHIAPRFSYGSRAKASAVNLQAVGGTAARHDWVALPLSTAAAAAAPSTTPPAAPAQPAAVPQPPSVPVAPVAPTAPKAADPEERLQTLKRLHERGLITDEEYRVKREEILRQL